MKRFIWAVLPHVFLLFMHVESQNAPICETQSMEYTEVEGGATGSLITDMSASDFQCSDDDGDTISYVIVSGNTGTAFSISGSQLLIDNTDAEAKQPSPNGDSFANPYTLVIAVEDDESPKRATIITIVVTLTSDESTKTRIDNISPASPITVAENLAVGTVIFTCDLIDDDFPDPAHPAATVVLSAASTLFYVDENNCIVTLKAPLDYETDTTHSITLKVQEDGADNGEQTTYVINVSPVNEFAPVCSPAVYTKASTAESTAVNDVLATVACTDSDTPNTDDGAVEYVAVTGEDAAYFDVDLTTGEISLKTTLDYENNERILTMKVAARDKGTSPSALSTTVSFLLEVTDVDDNAPVFANTPLSVSISENTESGATVIAMTATDSDVSEAFNVVTYALESACSQDWFTLPSSDKIGVLLVKDSVTVDYETAQSVTCQISASSDGGTTKTTETLTITITGENEHQPVFDQTLYEASVSENQPGGFIILTAVATDADSDLTNDGRIEYSLSADAVTANVPFEMNINSGELSVKNTGVNYETATSYSFNIVATDKATSPLATTAAVIITIDPVNDDQPDITSPTSAQTVDENQLPGTEVFTIVTTDNDDGDDGKIVYSLQETGLPFYLEPNSGKLKVAPGIDYEDTKSYTLTLVATDQSTNTADRSVGQQQVTVNIGDTNDNSPICTPVSAVVTHDSALGDDVAQLVCTDADETPTISWTETTGDTNNLFDDTITNGQIKTAVAAANLKTGVYEVCYTVGDGDADHNLVAPVEISVEETLTTNLDLTASVAEDYNPSNIIDTITSSGSFGLVTYVITAGNDDNRFHVHQTNGNVRSLKRFDFDTDPQHVLTVEARSVAGQTVTGTVTVDITDVNDNAPVYANSYYTVNVAESTIAAGSLITIAATDADSNLNNNNVIKYSIVTGDTSTFSYDEDTGQFDALLPLDFDTDPNVYEFILRATDQGSGSLSATVALAVHVTSVNESTPTFPAESGGKIELSLAEDQAIGSKVVQTLATDASDSDAVFVYSITSGNNDGFFSIDSTTGDVYLLKALDFETETSYSLGIEAEEQTGADTITTSLEITVTDVNDNDPVWTARIFLIEDQSPVASGVTLRTFVITDEDSGALGTAGLTLSILSGNDAGRFTIDGLALKTDAILDETVQSEYTLVLVAADGDGTPRESTATATVVVTPEFTTPEFDPILESIDLLETQTPGSTPVFDCDATNQGATEGDSGDVEYEITGGNDENKFYIEPYNGEVYLVQALSFASTQSYSLTITATNRNDNSKTSTLQLNVGVTQENLQAPVFGSAIYSATINENISNLQVILTVAATDSDPGLYGTINYKLETPSTSFNLDLTSGQLTVDTSIDWSDGPSYRLYLTAEDLAPTGPLTSTAIVVITVTDLNNHSPVFAGSPYTFDVPEDITTPAVIKVLVAEDLDSSAFDPVTYTITSGNDNNVFSIDSTTGYLTIETALDYETTTQYVLNVRATDAGGLTGDASVTVDVIAKNDNTPIFSSSGYIDATVARTAARGTVVSTLAATDADTGNDGVFRYAITQGNADTYFSIDSTSGEVTTSRDLTSASDVYALRIVAVDQGEPARTGTGTMVITMSTFGTTPTGDYEFTVTENLAAGTTVGTVFKVPTQTHTGYEIISGNANGAFDITMNANFDGVITTTGPLDRETYPEYQLTVRITTTTSVTDQTVVVSVTDVNDNGPSFNPDATTTVQSIQLVEKLPVGETVTQLSISDVDTGDNAVFTLAFADDDPLASRYFNIDDTGLITVRREINYEIIPDFSFKVVATDNGSPAQTSTGTFSVTITDVAEIRTISTQEPTYFVGADTPYDSPAGFLVYTLTPADFGETLGSGDTFAYISKDQSVFTIDESTGQITVTQDYLLYDKSRYFQWCVGVKTSGGVTSSNIAMIRIDTFDKNLYMVALVTSLSATDLEAIRSDLVTRLGTFFTSPQSARIIEIEATSSSSRRRLLATESVAQIVVVRDTDVETVLNVEQEKEYLTQDEVLAALRSDASDGTPAVGLPDGTIPVTAVAPYTNEGDTSEDGLSSTGLVVIITLSVLIAFALILALVIYLVFWRNRGSVRAEQDKWVEEDKKRIEEKRFKVLNNENPESEMKEEDEVNNTIEDVEKETKIEDIIEEMEKDDELPSSNEVPVDTEMPSKSNGWGKLRQKFLVPHMYQNSAYEGDEPVLATFVESK